MCDDISYIILYILFQKRLASLDRHYFHVDTYDTLTWVAPQTRTCWAAKTLFGLQSSWEKGSTLVSEVNRVFSYHVSWLLKMMVYQGILTRELSESFRENCEQRAGMKKVSSNQTPFPLSSRKINNTNLQVFFSILLCRIDRHQPSCTQGSTHAKHVSAVHQHTTLENLEKSKHVVKNCETTSHLDISI